MSIITNAFSVDVEDYYQVEAFSRHIHRKHWDDYASHVEKNTDEILLLLDNKNTKGTFFTLGCVAEKHPSIVRKIVDQGHEIASHGYSHKLIYKQSHEEFRNETIKSKAILEDIAQTEVRGYRAATYSITRKSLWALDILVDTGFIYDSSIFPIRHDRYGIPDINPFPHKIETPGGQSIVEFPISILKTKLVNLPIAGGGYFRLFPYPFTKWALERLNQQLVEFVFYIHPWEIDQAQPVIQKAGMVTKFRHYNNIKNCRQKLEKLLTDFKFDTLGALLESKQLIQTR
jgi:polysaccharide deacetylase family protein (PEP-CTERM system associated)